MTSIPEPHIDDSLKLNPEEFIELFHITLEGGSTILAHSGRGISWHPSDANATPLVFESAFIELSGVARNSGEQRVRPTLTIGNPADVFHVPVSEGHLDGATVIRYRIKPSLLDADPPVSESQTWYIAQVTGLGQVITCQLRSDSDRQEGQIPPRQYNRPEFSSVIL